MYQQAATFLVNYHHICAEKWIPILDFIHLCWPENWCKNLFWTSHIIYFYMHIFFLKVKEKLYRYYRWLPSFEQPAEFCQLPASTENPALFFNQYLSKWPHLNLVSPETTLAFLQFFENQEKLNTAHTN